MVVAARERGGGRERDGVVQRDTVPFRAHGLSSFALSSLLSLALSPSALRPSYIFRFLPYIVSTMIHWIPLTFFTRQPQKACTHTRTIHTVIHETRCTESSGVFRTFEFFPRVKSSIFSLLLLSRASPLDFHLPYRCFSISR